MCKALSQPAHGFKAGKIGMSGFEKTQILYSGEDLGPSRAPRLDVADVGQRQAGHSVHQHALPQRGAPPCAPCRA